MRWPPLTWKNYQCKPRTVWPWNPEANLHQVIKYCRVLGGKVVEFQRSGKVNSLPASSSGPRVWPSENNKFEYCTLHSRLRQISQNWKREIVTILLHNTFLIRRGQNAVNWWKWLCYFSNSVIIAPLYRKHDNCWINTRIYIMSILPRSYSSLNPQVEC